MKRFVRWSYYFFLIIAVGSTCVGLAMAMIGGGSEGHPAVGNPLTPDLIEVNLGELQPYSQNPFEVKIFNHGSVTARIVGTPGACALGGCVDQLVTPVTIAPLQEATFSLRLWVARKTNPREPYHVNTAIYFAVGDRPVVVVPIKVTWTVADAPASS